MEEDTGVNTNIIVNFIKSMAQPPVSVPSEN